MSDSNFTQTGRNEFVQAVERLPDAVTKALRSVALVTAHRVKGDAQQILRSKTHGTGKTADAIFVEEDAADQAFLVKSPGVPHPRLSLHRMKRSGRTHTQKVSQNNLPIWLEHGTSKMAARPYMRPAADHAQAPYRRDMEAASIKAVEDTLK
jgi:hypothetical protein